MDTGTVLFEIAKPPPQGGYQDVLLSLVVMATSPALSLYACANLPQGNGLSGDWLNLAVLGKSVYISLFWEMHVFTGWFEIIFIILRKDSIVTQLVEKYRQSLGRYVMC